MRKDDGSVGDVDGGSFGVLNGWRVAANAHRTRTLDGLGLVALVVESLPGRGGSKGTEAGLAQLISRQGWGRHGRVCVDHYVLGTAGGDCTGTMAGIKTIAIH